MLKHLFTAMNSEKVVDNRYRYERKFDLQGFSLQEVNYVIKSNPFHFNEIYHTRYINNIYFDSIFAYQSYFDNVDGAANRIKARIRWYGDLLGTIEKPVLEFKIKRGMVGRKDSFKLPSFPLDHDFNYHFLKQQFNQADLPKEVKLTLQSLTPAMMNRYKRTYYLSANGKYRLTIDSELSYYRINTINNTFINKQVAESEIILELKYAAVDDKNINKITSYFPFRMTKSSKYVKGMDLLYSDFS